MAVAPRTCNWSDEEIGVLAQEVTDNWETIRGKFSSTLTKETKIKAWEQITESVNAVSSIRRSVKKIKKKWTDVQSAARKKEANRRREQTKTGGGPPPTELKDWEIKVLSVIDDGVIVGLDGGFESLESSSCNMDTANSVSEEKDDPPRASTSAKKPICPSEEVHRISSTGDGPTQAKRMRVAQHDNLDERKKTDRLIEIEEEKLELKKRMFELEKKKVVILQGILDELKSKSSYDSGSYTLNQILDEHNNGCTYEVL